jgi:uncharacterized protein with HEPN domain
MNEQDIKLIRRINKYCKNVFFFIENVDCDKFISDLKTNTACMSMFEQIGENANKLSADFRTKYNVLKWQSMYGLRIKIAHDYEEIDLFTAWEIIINDLPELLKFTEEILKANT